MKRPFVSPAQHTTPSPVFGLRYLEEEAAEINGISGCNTRIIEEPIDTGNTYYTTNCDYSDSD